MQEYRISFYITGIFGCLFSLLMFIPALVEYHSGMLNFDIFMNSAFFGLFVSLLIVVTSYTEEATISRRSSFLATTLVWFVMTFITAIPLYFANYPDYEISIIDSLFEASSGLTTTGMSILSNLDNISKGVLLWRAMLHFFGGVGIITMVFIVMPYISSGAMQFFLTESSENQEKETPRILHFALLICGLYTALTVVCALLFYFFGMSFFDAICHAMATLSSGGFGTHDASFAFFESGILEVIAIFFMILAGIPFILIIRLVVRRKIILTSQIITMLVIFIIIPSLIFFVCDFVKQDFTSLQRFRHFIFAVVSLGTSTGFASADFSYLGGFFVMSLLFVTVIGGCTGSTSGGIKVFRVQVMYKVIKHHFMKTIYPHLVMKVKCDGKEISQSVVMSVVILLSLYLFFTIISTFVITAFGFSVTDALSISVGMLSNAGIIASEYGIPYSMMNETSQTIRAMSTLLMILGRLEFISVLIITMQLLKKV